MLRFLARFIGLWLIAGAVVTGVIDATRSIASSKVLISSLGESLFAINPIFLNTLQGAIQGHVPVIGPWLWDPVIQTLLLFPTALVLLIVGSLLVVAGRRRGSRRRFA